MYTSTCFAPKKTFIPFFLFLIGTIFTQTPALASEDSYDIEELDNNYQWLLFEIAQSVGVKSYDLEPYHRDSIKGSLLQRCKELYQEHSIASVCHPPEMFAISYFKEIMEYSHHA